MAYYKTLLPLSLILTIGYADKYLWEDFKKTHGKSYKSQELENHRYQTFLDNLQLIQEHNEKYQNGEVTYHMGITPFADLSQGEFKEWLSDNQVGSVGDAKIRKGGSLPDLKLPNGVDWRSEEGVVFEVPDGTQCKASWAYSSVGAVEGQNALRNNKRVKLSDQQIIACSNPELSGCNGGSIYDGFEYMKLNGINSNNTYPWQGGLNSDCVDQSGIDDKDRVIVEDAVQVSEYWEAVLIGVAYIGPMAALIDASYMQHYTGDVFLSDECMNYTTPETTNHGLLLVGYEGNESGDGYLLLRNSWGTSWGEGGYLRLTKIEHYNCGIYTNILYPKLREDEGN